MEDVDRLYSRWTLLLVAKDEIDPLVQMSTHEVTLQRLSHNRRPSQHILQVSHTFNDKKFQDFPGLSRNIKMLFQDFLGARQCLNKKTNSSYLLYLQSVIQCKKFFISHHCISGEKLYTQNDLFA